MIGTPITEITNTLNDNKSEIVENSVNKYKNIQNKTDEISNNMNNMTAKEMLEAIDQLGGTTSQNI